MTTSQTTESTRATQWTPKRWDPSSETETRGLLALRVASGIKREICTPEFFDWQCRRAPAGPALVWMGVDRKDENKIVGQYTVIPTDFSCGGNTVRAGVSVNLLVDENYRNQGMFLALVRRSHEDWAPYGMRFMTGFPNPRSYPAHVKHLNFTEAGDVSLLVRILRLSGAVRKRFPVTALRRIGGFLASLGDFYFKSNGALDPSMEVITAFDSQFDEFNGHLMRRHPVMVKRHSAYLNWRYRQSPIDYETLAIRKSGKVLGYVAYRAADFAGMRCGMILDLQLLGDSTSRETGDRLLQGALVRFASQGCDLAGALSLPGSPEREALRRSGFFVCPKRLRPQPFPYMIRRSAIGEPLEPDIFDLNNWFVAIGDYDAV